MKLCQCDRCGKLYSVSANNGSDMVLRIKKKITYETVCLKHNTGTKTYLKTVDLCDDCCKSLSEWYNQGKNANTDVAENL